MTFKPLLAVAYDPNKLTFPVYASPKLDGIRTLCMNGTALSRNLKPIPNNHIRNLIEEHSDVLDGYDGELLLEDMKAPFNEVSSAIMSRDGEPKFTYVVFDNFKHPEQNYAKRFRLLQKDSLPDFVQIIPTEVVLFREELQNLEAEWLADGFEGVMIRRADGNDHYKFGRSTVNEAILLKVKQFDDDEATIIGFEERLHNANEATKDALGHTERSSHKANMLPMDTLGALIVKCSKFDIPFSIGSGFDDKTRKEIWDFRDQYVGQMIKFKHQPQGAKKDGSPRFPIFLGMRYSGDMS